MAVIANLLVKIGADNSGLISGLGKAESAVSAFGKGAVDVAATSAKVFAGTMAAAGAAAGVLAKTIIDGYADYEQLVGGIDTLFKGSSQSIQKYAENAYKTAGLSANEYMRTVTGFSASLLQSLGGDTVKAVEYSNMAVTDMADNANKMGTSMEMIQNAYQGFAKQNYTMLDNLKLGYGGTKEEMARLLDDAGKIAGVKFNISSYADVVQAINVMQKSMGIAGTTALEAEKTISGSISTLQGAWSNLLVGFGKSGSDISGLVANVATSLDNVVNNITPVVDNMAKAFIANSDLLFESVNGIATGIIDSFIQILPTLIPTLGTLATNIFSFLAYSLLENSTMVVDAIIEFFGMFGQTFIDLLPLILDIGYSVITSLIEGITNNMPLLLAGAVDLISGIVDVVLENLPLLLEAGKELLTSLVNGLSVAGPMMLDSIKSLLMAFIDVIIQNLPDIIKGGFEILMAIIDAIVDNLDMVIDVAIEVILAILDGLIEALPDLIAWLPEIVDSVINAIIDNLPMIIDAAIEIIVAIMGALIDNLPMIVEAAVQIVGSILTALVDGIAEIVTFVPKLATALIDMFKTIKWSDLGKNIIDGIIQGINNGWNGLKDSLSNLAKNALKAAKDLLKIKSPSRLFADNIGAMIPAGIALGIEDNMSMIPKAMDIALNPIMPTTASPIEYPVQTSATMAQQQQTSEFDQQRFEYFMMELIQNFSIKYNNREVARMVRELNA